MSSRPDPPAMGQADDPPHVTRAIAAEAALWVARLHGPRRTREMELQCLQWQAQSAAHRHAFERCTETWMEVPNAARLGGFSAGDLGGAAGRGPGRRGLLLQLAAAALVAAGATGWLLRGGADDYRTAVGEAQSVMLADGTRLSLNTDTRVSVDFDARQRRVHVAGGEVVFEVARDTTRPFVVRVAGSEVEALGTVFSVRLLPGAGQSATESLAVTLVEGQVAVRAAAGGKAGAVAPPQPLVMKPGERVVLKAAGGTVAPPKLDRPRLEQVLAWQRNEAVFDQASLAEAVAEMNRYSRTPVVLVGELAQADGQARLVSGQFRTGDNAAFARALAALHGLALQEKAGRLELSRGSGPGR